MKITKEKNIIREVIEDILCNKCGESCQEPKGDEFVNSYGEPVLDFYGLIEARVDGGYFSTHLCDGEIYTFSLCEKCLIELFETFKHKPLT